MWILSIVIGLSADALIKAGVISVGASRKICQSIGHYGPAVGLIMLAFSGCDAVLAMIALCISVGLNGGTYAGYIVRPGLKLQKTLCRFIKCCLFM